MLLVWKVAQDPCEVAVLAAGLFATNIVDLLLPSRDIRSRPYQGIEMLLFLATEMLTSF